MTVSPAPLAGQSFHLSNFLSNISTSVARISIKFGTDFHGAQPMHLADFGHPLTFTLVPP